MKTEIIEIHAEGCNVKTEIIRIHAEGCNLRLMTIKVDDKEFTMRISHELYDLLRSKNVMTSQKLRWIKQKEKQNESNSN